jgi:thioredoxin
MLLRILIILGVFLLLVLLAALLLSGPLSRRLLEFQNRAEQDYARQRSLRNGLRYALAFGIFMLSTVLATLRLPLTYLEKRWKKTPPTAPIREIPARAFTTEVATDCLTLVDFWAEWCGPCIMMNPFLKQLVERHPGDIQVLKVNANFSQSLMEELGIRGLPTLLLYRNGRELGRHAGGMSLRELEAFCGLGREP